MSRGGEPGAVNHDLSPQDEQLWAVLNVIGEVRRDPDPNGFGYIYEDGKAIAEPLGEVADHLTDTYGLTRPQVFERFLAASELAVLIRQHVEPRMPEDFTSRRFN